MCTTVTQTIESEKFDSAGSGWLERIHAVVGNFGLHWASKQEFSISCRTSRRLKGQVLVMGAPKELNF